MKTHLQNGLAILLGSALSVSTTSLRADQLQMQNGDRYAGKIVSVTSNSIVFQSDVLGKLTLPRNKVSMLEFTATTPVPVRTSNSAPIVRPRMAAASGTPNAAMTNGDVSAALRNLGANTNFIQQVRQQMLTGTTPAVNQKYDEMVNSLMTGQMNVNDLRNQAKASIDQLKKLKQQMGPEADASLDTYLTILQNFVNETEPANPAGSFSTNAPAIQPGN